MLDPATYATFSPDLLMTAHFDGQVMLWDRRVHSPGKGVGRLWMSEKTPPWCMSVRPYCSFLLDVEGQTLTSHTGLLVCGR